MLSGIVRVNAKRSPLELVSYVPACGLKIAPSGGMKYDRPNFNIKKYRYNVWNSYDRSYDKLNENTKVVAVEGNVGVGKAKLAQHIAKVFDLQFVRDVTEDDLWKYPRLGDFDWRDYDVCLPKGAQMYTYERFWNDKDPIHHGRPLGLQYMCTVWRYWHYLNGLSDLFHTGQGFVSDRTPHSDYVWMKTFHKCGLLSTKAYEWYKVMRQYTVTFLPKPHLVVYINAPVDYVMKRIEQRGVPWEKGACNLNKRLLTTYKEVMEQDYLPRMSEHCEVMHVDVNELSFDKSEDLEYIVDHISKLDLDGAHQDPLDSKFFMWREATLSRETMDVYRLRYTDATLAFYRIFLSFTPPPYPEMKRSRDDYEALKLIIDADDRWKYDVKYDPRKLGAMKVMFDLSREERNLEQTTMVQHLVPL